MPKTVSDAHNRRIHQECVAAIVRIVKFLAAVPPNGSFSLGDLSSVGREGISEEAFGWVFEFIKDGVINLKGESIEEVERGDYSWVWNMTNSYLERFGYPRIEPEEISV